MITQIKKSFHIKLSSKCICPFTKAQNIATKVTNIFRNHLIIRPARLHKEVHCYK